MADKLDNLDFFSQKISLFVGKLLLHNLFCRDDLTCFLVLALEYCGELAFTKLGPPIELLVKIYVTRLHAQLTHPVLNHLLVLVVEDSCAHMR